jgi:REP element-mobilizing transposase RayT
MARKPRIQFEGAFYHIIVRGNQKQNIFLDDDDRNNYLERLQKYKTKYNFFLYAYVLMTNHVHLLIETPSDPISKIMQMVNFTYTRYFNKKYDKTGHLFQGRFISYLCDKENYLLSLIRYIHNNPVRAGMVKNALKYPWSSHKEYLEGTNHLVNTNKTLRLFSEKPSVAKLKYAEFMNDLDSDEHFNQYSSHRQQIIGDEQFIDEIQKHVKQLKRKTKKMPIKDLSIAIERETGVGLGLMISRKRGDQLREARRIFVLIAREMGYTMVELQDILKRDISVLSRLGNIDEMSPEGQRAKRVRERLNA